MIVETTMVRRSDLKKGQFPHFWPGLSYLVRITAEGVGGGT
jgi:hypothetical protein